jgi:hypothetical protein
VFYPSSVRRALKLKLFLELLYASFAGIPPWDRALIERGLLQEALVE